MTASPTQQALAEIRARGHEAWERASMVELQDLSLALAAAQVAAWQCRECCGARFGERCGSKAVQIERAIKMRERGAGDASVRAMDEICEHSEAYADIQAAWRLAKDMAPDGVRLADVANAVAAVERDLDGNGND